jgi:FAD/FMN-containing dehydrogenase
MSDLKIRTQTNDEITLKEEAINQFQQSLRGLLIHPGDTSYDEARKVYNAMYDRRPGLLVHAVGVADVMTVVKFAREHDLLLAVRGGGHSAPGFGVCDGGLVLDLRRMRGVRVDPERRAVRAEGGCTLGDLNHATYAFGLATPGGIVSTTGIGGLTLGGGLGYMTRRFGLTCDNLLSADVVLADGSFVTCSEEQEQDLFWALRGGGGNFGVVTSFEFRLHEVGDIYGGPIFFAPDAEVLRQYRDFILQAPEDLGAIFGLTLAAPLPFLLPEWHGKPVTAVITCWTGAMEDGEKIIEPIKSWGRVIGEYVARMPHPALNTLFDELLPPGLQNYWKGNFARTLSDEAIAAHLEHGAKTPNIQSSALIYPVDGACQRVPATATAYAYRDMNFSTVIGSAWPDAADNERNIQWAREYYEALRPHSEASAYVNFQSADEQDRSRIDYGQNYDRLVKIKTKYDPLNLFRLNHNIKPL